uniref:Uncharacterized protein n=1 Tax=Rhizophora mucronata TaxID=61149 RepID=A0A2P2PZ96_RHIMU
MNRNEAGFFIYPSFVSNCFVVCFRVWVFLGVIFL